MFIFSQTLLNILRPQKKTKYKILNSSSWLFSFVISDLSAPSSRNVSPRPAPPACACGEYIFIIQTNSALKVCQMYPQNRGTVRTRHKSLAVIYMEIRTRPGLCLAEGKWNLGIHLRFHFFLAFGGWGGGGGGLRPHQTDSVPLLQRSDDNDEEPKQGARVGKDRYP